MFTTNCLAVRTDVTCVKFIKEEIFAGIGGFLHIFDKITGKLKKIVRIFDGQKIYGVIPDSDCIQFLVYGGKQVKILLLQDEALDFEKVLSFTCKDWILDAKWVDCNREIVTIFMHNIVVRWSNRMDFISKTVCEEKCILYSARLVNETWDDLIVLSGTVFGQVAIWWPSKCEDDCLAPVYYRLVGHQGSIFSIDYNLSAGIICSTSDDRSVRLWSVANKSLLVELSQTNINITLMRSLFKHTSRVFQCKVTNNFVISGGEDSLVNIWDVEGNFIRQIDAHQSACVWSLDCDSKSIVTGSGNYGVTAFPLKYDVVMTEFETSEVPKRFVLLKNFDMVSISEKGLLEYHVFRENSRAVIQRHDDLISYALLEVSPCRKIVALAGFRGTIYFYEQKLRSLQMLCSYTLKDRSRIFSFHWLSSSKYLTCGPKGVINLWHLNENSIIFVTTFFLPPSKERWTTSACELNFKNIAMADRKGNVYLYSLSKQDPVQILRKAHNYLGVTYLSFKNNELTSLGRNSVVKKYDFNESLQRLTITSSDKLPFTWLAEIHKTRGDYFILAFLSKEFLIWDYKNRRTLIQFDCGGGHRSWDFYKLDDQIVFAYIKDKRVVSLKFNWSGLCPLDAISGHHVAEINSASCFHFISDLKQSLIISGGEDTTLRLSQFCHIKKVFYNLCTLKSHLSSIRAITCCKISDDKFLVVSAGGRAQIVSWNLKINLKGIFSTTCSEKFSFYEQLSNNESEMRIMDLCLIKLENNIFLLVAACSDGLLKVFHIVNDDFKIILKGNVFYKLKCIIKVAHLEIQGFHLVVSMATDGKIAFWDFTQVANGVNKDSCYFDMKPACCIDVHQSGINAFTYKVLSNERVLFLTGGDDNAFSLNLLEFKCNEDGFNVNVLSTFSSSSFHCSQITGVFLTNLYFLTTSIDQKLNIFSWIINESCKLDCDFIQKYNSSVADIQGMQCYKYKDDIYVYLYGVGVEFVRLQQSKEQVF